MSGTTSKIINGRLACPKCPSSDAYHEYDDGHGYCFSCAYYKPSNKEQFQDVTFTYEYLPSRGLSKKTLEFYDVKTKVDADGKPIAVGFKYPNSHYKVRLLAEKQFYWEPKGDVNNAGLFGQDKFTPGAHKYITITEGEYDALSIYQATGGPAVSVHSSSSAGRDVASARSWLNSYERVYLAFDNDVPGREAAAAVARQFDYDKVFHVKFTSRKDANEYLQNGETEQLSKIWWSAKKYLPDDTISTLEDFDKELKEEPKMGVSYPFAKLTEMTYGIRPGEIVLVTAQEKVGKTEFMHFLMHHLLKETDDAVAGLLIEESRRRTLQAIAGIELGRPVHLPHSGATPDQVTAATHKVVKRDNRLHLYTHARSDDPEVVLDRMRFYASSCNCRYILFDHPGMAVFGLGGDNERVLLDTLATKSALLVKELGFALIVVSHVNDFGQTRGSRYLGKVCDLRIDLTRDTANPDPEIRNMVNITIPYARYSSNSGPVGSYLFDQWTQRYTEVAANDNTPFDPLARSHAA